MKHTIGLVIFLISLNSGATTKEEVKTKASQAVEAASSYTKEQKEQFQAEMELKATNLKAEISNLQKLAEQKSGDAKVEMNKQIKALNEHQESLMKDLGKLKKSSGSAWVEMKGGVANAWDSLSTSFVKAKDKFKETK